MGRRNFGLGRGLRGLLPAVGVAAAAFAACAGVEAARAADLPVPGRAPAYAPQAYRPALYDWTGIYLGVHVGAGLLLDTQTALNAAVVPTGTQTKIDALSVLGGGQFGAQVEFSSLVLGFEGSFTDAALSGERTSQPTSISGYTLTSRASMAWYAAATGRVGYAVNDLLIYGKGGGAWTRASYRQLLAGANGSLQDTNAGLTGFIVGGGLEYGLIENLSVKFEYDFVDFGTKTYNFNNLTFNAGANAVGPFPVQVKPLTHMFTLGFNYRFTWAH